MRRRPVVLIPACNRMVGRSINHTVGRRYVEAVRLAGCLPFLVPFVEAGEIDELLESADGILLTGSPSNVHPSHFGEEVLDESLPLDPARDAWTLPLIPRAIERGVPLFAICRGFQEVNVALGGSLHQAVHAVPGNRDHRSRDDAGPEVTYALAHAVDVMPDGTLQAIVGEGPIEVNSAHGQGVNRLADGLRVEARAPDGLVESFSKTGSAAFNLAVQWHPEWQAASNPVSMRLLTAFGDACREHLRRREATGSPT